MPAASAVAHQFLPQRPIEAQVALRLAALRCLCQRIALVPAGCQQLEQLAVRVVGQVPDMDVADEVLEQVEGRLDRSVADVARIGVPADADRGVAAGVHDLTHDFGPLGLAAVDFDPDFDAVARRMLAAGLQRLANAADCDVVRHSVRQPVRAHLHAPAAQVVRQFHEAPGLLHVGPSLGRVRRVELAGRAEAQQSHAAVLEAVSHALDFRP